MITYNKLVRDNIPQIIKDSGKKCSVRILNDEEYVKALKEKIVEEAKELLEAKTSEDVIEELADLYEVVEALLIEGKIDLLAIKKKRIQKNMEKGAFDERVFLEYVE